MTETTTGKTFESADDHRSALVQWLADEFYNRIRTLDNEALEHLYRHIRSIPLEPAPSRFADFYSVLYDDVGSGARALIVETDEPMEIRPVGDRKIIIKRA